MPSTGPSPTTLRLMACLESLASDEAGVVGHDDWPGLVQILERELEIITRIACEKPAADPDLTVRANALRERYQALSARITAARSRDEVELASLGETGRRMRSVRQAYA